MIVPKDREQALTAPYIFQADIERALGVSRRQAAAIFRRAKEIDHEAGVIDISPRKVRRKAVELATGISFDRLLRTEKENGAKKGRPE